MSQLSTKLPWDLAQTKWAASINPVLALPILNGNEVDGINLVANKPQAINHLLQRMPLGWFLLDNTANTVVWRTASFTTTTITLQSSANTTINLWVF